MEVLVGHSAVLLACAYVRTYVLVFIVEIVIFRNLM